MVSMRYLLNQLMDFDQNRRDTLFEEGKSWLDLGNLDLNFQGQRVTLKCQILTKIWFLYDIS